MTKEVELSLYLSKGYSS